jgi:hypothetical protein
MTTFHKEVFEFLQSCTLGENAESISDQDIIKGLVVKTKELLNKIDKLKVTNEDGTSTIDLKVLESKGLPPKILRYGILRF